MNRRTAWTAIAVAALALLTAACGGGGAGVEAVRASASVLPSTTTTTVTADTTTSTTDAPAPTTTSAAQASTTTTRSLATTTTAAVRPPTTRPTPVPTTSTPPTTRFPGDTRRAIAWTSVVASGDGMVLTFSYYSGVPPCSIDDGVEVEEASSTVRVTIFERDGSGGQPCIAIAQQKSKSVALRSPLARRKVVDGAKP